MRIVLLLLGFVTLTGFSASDLAVSQREYIPGAYRYEVRQWWYGLDSLDPRDKVLPASPNQRYIALWFAENYGLDVGSKAILESAAGRIMDHGDEKSHKWLGLNVVQHVHRPEMTREAFVDSLERGSPEFHGELCRDKLDDDLWLFRHKVRPDYNTAFVYPGWKLYQRRKTDKKTLMWRKRTHRALLDMAFQELLEGALELGLQDKELVRTEYDKKCRTLIFNGDDCEDLLYVYLGNDGLAYGYECRKHAKHIRKFRKGEKI